MSRAGMPHERRADGVCWGCLGRGAGWDEGQCGPSQGKSEATEPLGKAGVKTEGPLGTAERGRQAGEGPVNLAAGGHGHRPSRVAGEVGGGQWSCS